MSEEREGESGVAADAAETLVDISSLHQWCRGKIGELATLQIAPDLFDGIEVRGITGKSSTTSHRRCFLRKACMALLRCDGSRPNEVTLSPRGGGGVRRGTP